MIIGDLKIYKVHCGYSQINKTLLNKNKEARIRVGKNEMNPKYFNQKQDRNVSKIIVHVHIRRESYNYIKVANIKISWFEMKAWTKKDWKVGSDSFWLNLALVYELRRIEKSFRMYLGFIGLNALIERIESFLQIWERFDILLRNKFLPKTFTIGY